MAPCQFKDTQAVQWGAAVALLLGFTAHFITLMGLLPEKLPEKMPPVHKRITRIGTTVFTGFCCGSAGLCVAIMANGKVALNIPPEVSKHLLSLGYNAFWLLITAAIASGLRMLNRSFGQVLFGVFGFVTALYFSVTEGTEAIEAARQFKCEAVTPVCEAANYEAAKQGLAMAAVGGVIGVVCSIAAVFIRKNTHFKRVVGFAAAAGIVVITCTELSVMVSKVKSVPETAVPPLLGYAVKYSGFAGGGSSLIAGVTVGFGAGEEQIPTAAAIAAAIMMLGGMMFAFTMVSTAQLKAGTCTPTAGVALASDLSDSVMPQLALIGTVCASLSGLALGYKATERRFQREELFERLAAGDSQEYYEQL